MTEALPSAYPTDQATISQAEDRVSVAPNWKLVWWRFRKNKLAVVSAVVLIVFYAVVFVPDFFATLATARNQRQASLHPAAADRLLSRRLFHVRARGGRQAEQGDAADGMDG